MIYQKFSKALTILSIFEDLYGAEEGRDYTAVCFDNGREQGFGIRNTTNVKTYKNIVYFSENRNSDDIVVYLRDLEKPEDEMWSTAQMFGSTDYMGAVKYIHKIVNEWE